MLPDAAHRGGRGFKDSYWADEVVALRAPLGSLFDVDALLAWAASAGAVLHTVHDGLRVRVRVRVGLGLGVVVGARISSSKTAHR